MHFPFCGKKRLDILRRKKLRRTVRTINDAQRAHRGKLCLQSDGQFRSGCARRTRSEMQHVTATQCPSGMSAKLTKGERAFAA